MHTDCFSNTEVDDELDTNRKTNRVTKYNCKFRTAYVLNISTSNHKSLTPIAIPNAQPELAHITVRVLALATGLRVI